MTLFDIWKLSPELLLKLRGMTIIKQRLNSLLVEKVDFSHSFFFKEIFYYSPNEGNWSGNSHNITNKHPWSISIREESKRFSHRSNEWKYSNFICINYSDPILYLTWYQKMSHYILEEVGLSLDEFVLWHTRFNDFFNIED